ncbi:MAG: hypothetical protein RBR71_03455 [Gudongella sp.]|nr:hypothetical protein [Gudongella sp.]
MIKLMIEKKMAKEIVSVLDGLKDCIDHCNKCFNPDRLNETIEILIDLLKEGE